MAWLPAFCQPSMPSVQDDWLEVAAGVLPLWQATPLAPFAGPKALLHYLLCPQPLQAAAEQLVKVRGAGLWCPGCVGRAHMSRCWTRAAEPCRLPM